MSTATEQFLPPEFGRPHVVILGAGASRAAFPKGNKHGIEVPLMDDLVEILDLKPMLSGCDLDSLDGNFEAAYSQLATSGKYPDVLDELERRVNDYFARLKLPDEPTLYDHLVLSLRPKDVIATFNWDPFLWQAWCRSAELIGEGHQPTTLYLHGNVGIGYCNNHSPGTLGHRGSHCLKCGAALTPSRLFYPLEQKNYTEDPSIAKSWANMQQALKRAYLLTIFGYRAPATDVEAVRLLREAWGDADSRDQEEVQIIDIRSADELYEQWKPFICREHYGVGPSFYDSLAAQHPRRSCEDFREAAMQSNPQEERPIPHDKGWDELRAWLSPLITQEQAGVAVER